MLYLGLLTGTWGTQQAHYANKDVFYFEKESTYRYPMKYFSSILLNIFFFCSTHGFDIELYDILYSILCKLYILRIGVLDWHIHCARVWYEIKNIVQHSLDFHLGCCRRFNEVEMYQVFFVWLIQDFVLKFLNMHYFSFFSQNGFSFKKNHSFCLSVGRSFFLSVCLSIRLCHRILLWNFEYALFLFLALVDDTPWWKISIK